MLLSTEDEEGQLCTSVIDRPLASFKVVGLTKSFHQMGEQGTCDSSYFKYMHGKVFLPAKPHRQRADILRHFSLAQVQYLGPGLAT